MNPVEKVKSITLDDLSECNGKQRKEYKSTIKTHLNMLKGPISERRERRGGLKVQENIRETKMELIRLREETKKLIEFKNMFSGLYEALLGPTMATTTSNRS